MCCNKTNMSKYLVFIPQILVLLLLCLEFVLQLAFPSNAFYNIKQQYAFFYDAAIAMFIISSSLLWISFYPPFKEFNLQTKILYAFLSIWILALNFTIHLEWQTFVLFALYAIYYGIRNKHFRIPDFMFWLAVMYFSWHLISLIWMPEFNKGLNRLLFVYLLFLVVPIVFCLIEIKQNMRDMILLLFFRFMFVFVGISLCCWIAQSVYLNMPISDWFVIKKATFNDIAVYDYIFAWSNYYHPTYNAVAYLFALACGFYMWQKKLDISRVNTIELAIYTCMSLVLVLITQSRIGIITWFLVFVLGIAYLLRRHKKLIIFGTSLSFIMLVIAMYFASPFIESFFKDTARVQNFGTAFAYIKTNYLLGTGVEGIRAIMDSEEFAHSLGYEFAYVGLANPHHQFIGDLMQTGIVGVLLSLAMTIYLFVISIKRHNYPLLVFMVIFFMIMQIEMPFYLPKGTMFFLAFVFLLCPQSASNSR